MSRAAAQRRRRRIRPRARGCRRRLRDSSRRQSYHRLVQIAVIGSGEEWTAQAEEVGRLLGQRGCVVVCGGLGEVMEAAARGAKSAGGTTIGILPGESPNEANPWIDYRVATGTG